MDVSCPRCQTEYEFDEARITEDGVTVKCTECGHVFRVRKTPEGELPPAPQPREWKIRRRSTGTTSTCRELTSLQQWIVEGKVGREDEISLTGETWKRLGDIPELASFFQVVDDAAKARAYESVRSASQGVSVSSNAPTAPNITETWREPNFKAPLPAETLGPVPSSNLTLRGGFAISQDQGLTQPLSSNTRRKPLPAADELELERAIQGSGAKWPALIVLSLIIAAALGWYFGSYQPEQNRLAAEQAAKAAVPVSVPVTAVAPVAQLTGAPTAVMFDAGALEAITVRDAGQSAGPSTKFEGKSDFDSLQRRGEALLAQDKPDAALSLFGRAAELKPERVEPLVGKGLALLDLNNAPAAEAAFERAIGINPRYGPGIMGLAESLRTQGKNERAIEWYERYLEVMPDGTEANVARHNIERLRNK